MTISVRSIRNIPLNLLELRTQARKYSRASLVSDSNGRNRWSCLLSKTRRNPKDAWLHASPSSISQYSVSEQKSASDLKSVRSIPSMSRSYTNQDDCYYCTGGLPSLTPLMNYSCPNKTPTFRDTESARTTVSGRPKSNRTTDYEPSTICSSHNFHHPPRASRFDVDRVIERDSENYVRRDTDTASKIAELQEQQMLLLNSVSLAEADEESHYNEADQSKIHQSISNNASCKFQNCHHLAEELQNSSNHRASDLEIAQPDPKYARRGRASSVTSCKEGREPFDNAGMLASTLGAGIVEERKQDHWLKIKGEMSSLKEDAGSAPAPAVSTRAERHPSMRRSSSSSKNRHSMITSILPAANGTKSPSALNKSEGMKNHGKRALLRSHNDSISYPVPSTEISPSQSRLSDQRSSLSSPPRVSLQSPRRVSLNETVSHPHQAQQRASGALRSPSMDSIDTAVRDFLLAPRLSRTVQHPAEDRVIAYSDVGDPKGRAVVVCLGMGLTRFVMALYDDLARALKIRLITPDRAGVGGSEPCDESRAAPLTWPDDISVICNHLKITRFSLLAHSAGAIYALATALRMPQHIIGRIHLLAPWIPPSQIEMSNLSLLRGDPSHSTNPDPKGSKPRSLTMPYSQRILKALPIPIFKVANCGFMSVTSASVSPNTTKYSSFRRRRRRRKSSSKSISLRGTREIVTPTEISPNVDTTQSLSSQTSPPLSRDNGEDMPSTSSSNKEGVQLPQQDPDLLTAEVQEAIAKRNLEFDARLTNAIWECATTNANPSVDLLVCLERRQPIGFRYADVSRPVVIHHGARDTRVPVENVRWLGRTMQNCEVRILEQEGHSLMAKASLMSNILMEIANERDDRKDSLSGESNEGTAKSPRKQSVSGS
ncbi:hypothetical protein KEM54_000969 [Ascosphaera aggregata]|nr:hypothetical protein KEM54_000969 [Ascosphaera aggregata]